MEKNKIWKKYIILWIILSLIIIFVVIQPLFIYISTEYHRNKYAQEYPTIKLDEIEPGDIIFARSAYLWDVIPKYWAHIAFVSEKDETGSLTVIESTIFTKAFNKINTPKIIFITM
jgi:hypothetical protein